MKQPFFSLITPVYNIEKLLPITIESALRQTFIDWEMILVDDGSPDNAGAVCDAYVKKDSRIKVVHKKNEGLAAARNTGIENACGKYFIILEGSDLFFDNNTLQNIYNDLIKNEVDIYFGRLQDVMEKDMKVTNVQSEYCISGLYKKGGKNLFVELSKNQDVLALSSPVNKAFRTAFIKDNGLWFYKGLYHDDDEWIPRTISLSNTAYFTNEVIYNALAWDGSFLNKINERSLTKKNCDKMFIAKHCLEDIDERFPEKNSEFKKEYYEYYVRMYFSSVSVLNIMKEEECKKKVEEAYKENKSVFKYASKCMSKNLKLVGLIKKLLGLNFAKKMIIKRYK